MRQITIRVTDEMYAGIEARAAERGFTVEEMTVGFIYAHLVRLQELEGGTREEKS